MTLPALQSAVVDGSRVSWRERGDGPAMVLIHGIGGSSESWRAMFDTLASSCRVIAWDAPGYGGSALDTPEPTSDAYARRLYSLLVRLNALPHHILAHSIGSPIAAALRRLLPLGCVRTMTLVHPVSGFGGMDAKQRDTLRSARLADIAGMTMAEFGKRRAPQILGAGSEPAIVNEVADIIGRIPAAGYRAMVEVMASADLGADLPSISAPTLVVAGTADVVAPPDVCRGIVKALPSGTYEELDGVGHYAPLERPQALLSMIREVVTGPPSP